MHLLEAGEYSLDANVVVDFYKADHLPLLSRLLPRRLLMSDLVAAELAAADIYYPDPAVIKFDSDQSWELFGEIRSNPALPRFIGYFLSETPPCPRRRFC